jgi:cytochrome c peroxidase
VVLSKSTFFAWISILITLSAYASEGMLREQVQSMAAAVFDPLPSVTQVLDENEYSDAMVDLGRFLFFDKRMSAAGDISCASCHGMDTGGGDGRATSVGHMGAIGGQNAPSVFNAIFNVERFSTEFPDQDEPITFDNIATAIAAFEAMHDRMQNHDAHVNGGTKR